MDAFDYNFAHSIATFAACSKSGEVQEWRDLVLTHHHAPVAEFNQCLLKTPGYKLERTLDRIRAFQQRVGVPLRLHLASEWAGAAPALEARGATQVRGVPALVFDARQEPRRLASSVAVSRVIDEAALAEFGRMAFTTFGYPADLAPVTFTEQLLDLPHAELLLGRVGGEAACCAMVLCTGDVAGIYWVGVAERHRRQGLGTAITHSAITAGIARGCRTATLQASPMGDPMYRRLGFQPLRSYLRFDLPADA